MRRAVTLLCLATASCGGADDGPLWGDSPVEPVDLRAALDVTEAPLLEEVEVRLHLYSGPGMDAALSAVAADGYSIRTELGPESPLGEGSWRRITAWVRPTRVGELTIGPFEARAAAGDEVARTRELSLVVTSLLADAEASVEAPAPPFPPGVDPWPWVLGALAVAVLIAGVWYWRRRRPAAVEPVGVAVPPHVKARRALGKLRNAPRSTPPQVERFYVDVSQILRVYLEERYGMHAPERTTEEFLLEVEYSDDLGAAERASLRPFLTQCDLVKFARALPGEDVHAETFETAEQFVEATRGDQREEEVA